MEIRIFPEADGYSFAIVTANGKVIAEATQTYANKRNALAAAKLIAGSKFKVTEA